MKKLISILLTVVILFSVATTAFATSNDYKIVSPYEDVIWGVTGEYKGNLHTHSTYSDSQITLTDTILEHYEQGFDFVAMTDHGVTGVEWNKKAYQRLLYSYQTIIGKKQDCFSDEEYYALLDGTHTLRSTGEARGSGMTCVTGGNELNALTASKSHVNGYFLPSDFGNTNLGYESEFGYEYAVKIIDEQGGLSHLNHLGDWLDSNKNINAVYDDEKLEFFKEILLKYDSCLGIEVFNEKNTTTPYDRILWDNLLMKTLPYGRNIIGFSNNDTHEKKTVDSSFSVFMMEENTVENIKEAMQSGSFFMVTRKMKGNDVIGPENDFDVMDQLLPCPMFTNLTVSGHKVFANAKNVDYIQWIANGKVIYKQDVSSSLDTVVLDIDKIGGSEDFLYVRAEAYGEGGLCASQALVIDDGSEPLSYEQDNSIQGIWTRIVRFFKSLRVYVYIEEIVKSIKGM